MLQLHDKWTNYKAFCCLILVYYHGWIIAVESSSTKEILATYLHQKSRTRDQVGLYLYLLYRHEFSPYQWWSPSCLQFRLFYSQKLLLGIGTLGGTNSCLNVKKLVNLSWQFHSRLFKSRNVLQLWSWYPMTGHNSDIFHMEVTSSCGLKRPSRNAHNIRI